MVVTSRFSRILDECNKILQVLEISARMTLLRSDDFRRMDSSGKRYLKATSSRKHFPFVALLLKYSLRVEMLNNSALYRQWASYISFRLTSSPIPWTSPPPPPTRRFRTQDNAVLEWVGGRWMFKVSGGRCANRASSCRRFRTLMDTRMGRVAASPSRVIRERGRDGSKRWT